MTEKYGLKNGQAAVEFVLILVLFLIMLLGALDFGIIYYDQAMLINASREGARVAIVMRKNSSGTCLQVPKAEIVTAIDNYLSGKLINFYGAPSWQVPDPVWDRDSWDCSPDGGTVTVSVQYRHTYLAIPAFLGFGRTIPLAAQTTMNRE